MNALSVAAELDQLAERIARLRPISNRNPHVFYEERSEVAHDIRSIADHLRGKKPPPAIDAPRPPLARATYRIEHADGRTTLVVNRHARRPPPSPGGP